MIGRRASQMGLWGTLLLATGLALGNGPILVWALTVIGLVFAAFSLDPPSKITAQVALDRSRPRVGDLIELQVDVHVRRGIGPVLVRLPLPDALQLAAGSNLLVVWKGRGPVRRRMRLAVRAASRGPVQIGSIEARPVHPMRMRTESVVTLGRPIDLVVSPRVRKVHRVRHLRGKARTVQPAGDIAKLGPKGSDFDELRPYHVGDPLRNVNWKATARHSTEDLKLMVNEYEPEGKKSVWLFLDAAAYMEVGSTHENALDHALEGALGILNHFTSRGYRVGATVYHQPETLVYYPDVGTRQLRRLTNALATVTAHNGGEGLDLAVHRTRGFLLRERPLALVVTRPEAEPDATRLGTSQLQALGGSGRRQGRVLLFAPTPVLHLMEGGHHPLSAAALRLSARGTYQDLRRQGVRVLDWDPGQASLERLLLREVVAR